MIDESNRKKKDAKLISYENQVHSQKKKNRGATLHAVSQNRNYR
jgi:hypothetical protein